MVREKSTEWDHLRRRVYERDKWHCQACGRMGGRRGDAQLHAHHIVKKSEGGADSLANLITLCDRCHAQYHGNPYLLENGPPPSISWANKLYDFILIDILGGKPEERRRQNREKSEESDERIEWRNEGLEALEKLAERLDQPAGIVDRIFGNERDATPRLYTTTTGGYLTRTADKALNQRFNGCQQCGRHELTAEWIHWRYRGRAKRISCTSCEAIYQERIINQNGRAVRDLERARSEFELDTIASPIQYRLTTPGLTRYELEDRYGTDCSVCETANSLHNERIWRKTDLLPRHLWICQNCPAEFAEKDGELLTVHDTGPISEEDTSVFWYYLIMYTVPLSILSVMIHPVLILASGLLFATGVYKDIEYVRAYSEQNPSTRLWTWSALLLNVLVGISYIVFRKRSDTSDSNLHKKPLQNMLKEFAFGRK